MATKKTAKKTTEPISAAKAKAAGPTAKKAAKTSRPVIKVAAKSAVKKASAKPSPDVIARAAYLNYRRRVEQGLPGDSRGDWLEAERYFTGKHEA